MANLAYLQLCRLCNQECLFCSNPANSRILKFNQVKKLIDGFISSGYEGIILTGGEPTLCPDLGLILKYCKTKKIETRVITNGQKLADFKYLMYLIDSGLEHLNVSLFSVNEKIQSALTRNKDSLGNVIETLDNLSRYKSIDVNINTVINKYNADHLSLNVEFIVERYPFINHFIWNNLDPLMNRASKNRDTIPRLNDFELELYLSMQFLSRKKKTFRVERVPLCYMPGFEEFSTETRKIVKDEERMVYFLDERHIVRQNRRSMWFYDKAECCQFCTLNSICAGLYQLGKYYSPKELFSVFVNKNEIIKKIKV